MARKFSKTFGKLFENTKNETENVENKTENVIENTENVENVENKTENVNNEFKNVENVVKNNVIIYVGIGKKPNFKKFSTNSNILCSKSNYFKKILSDKDIEKKNGKYVINLPNITPQIFKVIIKYISTGNVNITNKTGTEILDIIIASDDLKVYQLVNLAQDFFKNHQFLRHDPIRILQIICDRQLENLREFCLNTVCFEPEILFNSVNFINLPASLLCIILSQDDLVLDEIEVWEYLIKWGLAQDETLDDDDVSEWHQEKFIILERILHKFIPLIGFYSTSSENYFNKVRLYEKILPKELQEEIFNFHMEPGYKPTTNNILPRNKQPDSVLINRKHLAIFRNWIDKNKGNENRNYKFNLLYRASRDGNTAAAFHEKCDNNSATIVIAKIKNSDHIVGGYNPLDWNSRMFKYDYTEDSFIFSFTNRNNFQTARTGYIKESTHSIYCNRRYGPTFGSGHDLSFQPNIIENNSIAISCNPCSYTKIDLPSSKTYKVEVSDKTFDALHVEDYEVFQVCCY